MATIGIITYAHPHLKTEQVLLSLSRTAPSNKMIVYGLPYRQREKRPVLIEHRPDQENAVAPQVLCDALDCVYVPCAADTDIDGICDLYLITGAGILSPASVRGKQILNCHPGILPAMRGLDSFKWAILRMRPVGNTLHYIDEAVDAGEIVATRRTPLFITDSLASFARRHYECEIQMLCEYASHLAHPKNPFEGIAAGEPTRRMNLSTEGEMCRIFDAYKERYAEPSVFH